MEIDFLLEEEKRKMEQSVLSSFSMTDRAVNPRGLDEKEEIEEKKPQTQFLDNTLSDKDIEKSITVDPKKKKKYELVDDFMKLQEERGDIKIERKKLERMTKGAIIKEMAEYVNEVILPTKPLSPSAQSADGIEEINNTPTEHFADGELNPHQLELVSHGLFQMNQVLVSLLETGSAYAKDKTGGIAVLENWSQKTLEKKQQFLDVFKLIYKDYKVELDKYLSPVVQYSILMGNSAAEVIVANIKKKKELSQQK